MIRHRRDRKAPPRDDRQPELVRQALEQIVDMDHPLVRLAKKVDWGSSTGGLVRSTSPATAIRRMADVKRTLSKAADL